MKPKIGEIYTHYKDPSKPYKIVGIAMYTENEKEMVVYEPLYEGAGAPLFVRDLDMFVSLVEVNGQKVPRFSLKQ